MYSNRMLPHNRNCQMRKRSSMSMATFNRRIKAAMKHKVNDQGLIQHHIDLTKTMTDRVEKNEVETDDDCIYLGPIIEHVDVRNSYLQASKNNAVSPQGLHSDIMMRHALEEISDDSDIEFIIEETPLTTTTSTTTNTNQLFSVNLISPNIFKSPYTRVRPGAVQCPPSNSSWENVMSNIIEDHNESMGTDSDYTQESNGNDNNTSVFTVDDSATETDGEESVIFINETLADDTPRVIENLIGRFYSSIPFNGVLFKFRRITKAIASPL